MKLFSAMAAAVGILAAATVQAADAPADPAKAQQIVTTVCAACHGADGNSVIPVNPKLAGQHEGYILKQLTEFKSGVRKGTVMNGMAAPLSPEDMKSLAAYFSSQKANPGKAADPAKFELGQAVYRGGNAKTGLPACAGCHGATGAGVPVQFPRLSGQNVDYVVSQLNAFRAGDRANDTNKMMQTIAAKMSDKEIAAVADYVSALK